MFTSGANQADLVWLAVRTDPDVAKHKGTSILAVPTSSPGFSWLPIVTVGSIVTTATYYSDVGVSLSARIGHENEGWRMITNRLNHERVGLAAMGGLAHRLLDEVTDWTRSEPAGPDCGRLIDVPWVQLDLARAHARMEAMKLLNRRMTMALDAGTLSPADSSAVKVYGTECLIDTYQLLLGIMGPVGYLRQGSPRAALRGRSEQASRAAQVNTFGGGVNEIQREIVAAAGLGMARQAR